MASGAGIDPGLGAATDLVGQRVLGRPGLRGGVRSWLRQGGGRGAGGQDDARDKQCSEHFLLHL